MAANSNRINACIAKLEVYSLGLWLHKLDQTKYDVTGLIKGISWRDPQLTTHQLVVRSRRIFDWL